LAGLFAARRARARQSQRRFFWQGRQLKELHRNTMVTVTGYFCDRCGAHWHYTNDKTNQRAGWSLAPE
jgi:hypothetical protein